MSSGIEFKNVVGKYKSGNHALNTFDNVSFTVDEGEFVVIPESSVAGKSTLLNIPGGLRSVTTEIIVNNLNFNDNGLAEYLAKNRGFVFQFCNPILNLTAFENVELMRDIVDVDIVVNECPKKVGFGMVMLC